MVPRLHLVAAHLVVVEAFEPAAQIFGGRGVRAIGVLAGAIKYLAADEDRAIGTQREGDGVRWPCVDGDGFALLVEPDGGVEGVLQQRTNDDAGDARVEAV